MLENLGLLILLEGLDKSMCLAAGSGDGRKGDIFGCRFAGERSDFAVVLPGDRLFGRGNSKFLLCRRTVPGPGPPPERALISILGSNGMHSYTYWKQCPWERWRRHFHLVAALPLELAFLSAPLVFAWHCLREKRKDPL